MSLLNLRQHFKHNVHHPLEAQRKVFADLSRIYQVNTYDEFTAAYPISDYNELSARSFYKDKINPQVDYYVRSSGTTSAEKHIPISKTFLAENHQKVARYCLYNLLFHFRQYHLFNGRNLALTGYTYPQKYNDIPVYDISALLFQSRPLLYKYISYPRMLFANWEAKLSHLKSSFRDISKSTSISGVPTWMFSLFNQLEKERGISTHLLFPKLKLIIHGGVNFANYFEKFNTCFPDRKLEYFETYNATEGFYGFQLSPASNALVLCTNAGIFYEFKNETGVFPIWEVQPGGSYELLISNRDGLIRYKTGDIISIQSVQPFLFTISGRTTEYTNAFGEDLVLSQTNKAIEMLSRRHNINILDYFVVPHYSSEKEIGYHEWYFFVDHPLPNKAQLEKELDAVICDLNNNYRQKRHGSLAMQNLRIIELWNNGYQDFIRRQNKNVGGQAKIKKLHNDRKILQVLKFDT